MAKPRRRHQDHYEEWAGGLKVVGVFMGNLAFTVNRDACPKPDERTVESKASREVDFNEGDHLLRGVASYVVEARRVGAKRPFGKVKVSYEVLFEATGDEVPVEHMDELAKTVLVMTWPYLRETVDGLATKSGIPMPPVPLMIRGSLEPGDAE